MPKISTQQLTDTRVQRAPIRRHPKTGVPVMYYLWDSVIRGFAVRVTPHGTKTFCFKYVSPSGKQSWMPLGNYLPPSPPANERAQKNYLSPLDTAREKARLYRDQLSKGKDPITELNKEKDAPTLEMFIKTFLEEQKEVLRPSSYNAAGTFLTDLVAPVLGGIYVADVQRPQVEELYKKVSRGWRPGMKAKEVPKKATPIHANRMLANLAKLFTVAERKGFRPQGTNPCRLIKKNPESKGKERFLTSEELLWLGWVLRDAPYWPMEGQAIGPRQLPKEVTGIDVYAIAAVRLLLATGARLNEILQLKWSQVDKVRRVLRIEHHKTSGRTGVKELPINSEVASVLAYLEALPTRHANKVWVIQGRKSGSCLVNLQKPWQRLREAAGVAAEGKVSLNSVRIHDLRHTHASWGVMAGLSLPKVGNLLGHTQPITTQRYGHFDVDPRREASELIASRIAAAMGSSAPTTDSTSAQPTPPQPI